MPKGRPKGSKNRVKSEVSGELLPALKEITAVIIEGTSQKKHYELGFNVGLEQREGLLLLGPDTNPYTIKIIPAVAGHRLGDNDEDGNTFCTFTHDGFNAPCLYTESDGCAVVELIEPSAAAWLK